MGHAVFKAGFGRRLSESLTIAGLAFTSIILAGTLAWIVLAKANFLYSVWHEYVGINEGIERYAPENKFKKGFEETSLQERAEMFAEINRAVHNHGDGLADITYESSAADMPQALLREPEVVHLQDVANLLDVLKVAVIVNAVMFFVCLFIISINKKHLISLRSQLIAVGAGTLLLITMVLLIGPVDVFNQLHIWIFPSENQWFFYYQDSLMSTMMLAPVLFGWIAAALVIITLVFYFLITFFMHNIERRFKGG